MILYETFEEINKKLECCLLKGIEDLPQSFAGKKDIDLLVYRKDQFLLQKILVGFGFRQVVSGWHKMQHGTEHYVLYESETDQFHHLHVHYKIIFGILFDREYELPYVEDWISLATLHSDYPIKVLPLELNMVFEMLRSIVETNYNFKSKVRAVLAKLIKNNKFIYNRNYKFYKKFKFYYSKANIELFQKYLYRYFSFAIIEINKLKSWYIDETLTPLKHMYLRSRTLVKLKQYRRINNKDARLLRSLRKKEVKDDIAFRSLSSGGMIISIIGADGTGKSTMCDELKNWLKWGRFTVRILHLGEPKGLLRLSFINYLIKVSGLVGLKSITSYFDGLSSLIKAKKRAQTIKKAHYLKNKGFIVITDRYPLKEFWDKESKMDSPKLNFTNKLYPRVISLFENFPDYPDALIFLTAPDEIIISRRQEEVISNPTIKNTFVQKNKDVKKVASELNSKIFNTSEAWDVLYNKVRAFVWSNL
ncbi:MAG: hypothetical protein ACLFMO_05490 [Eubacteriales bacterium]